MPDPIPRRLARARIVALAIVGSLIAAAGLGFVRMQALREHAAREVARALGDAFGLRASVRSAELDFAGNALVARGVKLADGARTVLEASTLRIGSSWDALLSGRVELRSVEIAGGSLALSSRDLERLERSARAAHSSIGRVALHDLRLSLALAPLPDLAFEHAELVLGPEHEGRSLELRGLAPMLGSAPAAYATAKALRFQGKLANSGAALGASGRLELEQATIAGRVFPDRLELALHADPKQLALEGSYALPSGAGSVGYVAKLELAGARTLELTLKPAGARLSALLALLGLPAVDADARLDGTAELRGQPGAASLDGAIDLEARALELGRSADPSAPLLALPAARIRADARLDAAGVALAQLKIAVRSSELEGEAQAGSGGELRARLRGNAVDLADFGSIAGVALAGRGEVTLGAQGKLSAPELAIGLGLERAALFGTELGKLTAELRIEDGARVLRVERIAITSNERKLSADGMRLGFDHGLTEAEARLQVTRLPLADLYRVLGAADDPMLSRLAASARGSAELSYGKRSVAGSARKLELSLALELEQPDLYGVRFERGLLRGQVAIPDAQRGIAGGALNLAQLRLESGEGSLEFAGAMQNGALGMHLALKKLAFARVPWLKAHLPALDGALDAKGELRGSSSKARAELDVALDGLRLAGRALGRAKLHALLRGRGEAAAPGETEKACPAGRDALASGALFGAPSERSDDSAWLICGDGLDGRLQVDLALASSESRAVRGRVALEGFSLAPFLPEQAKGERVPGRLSATLELTRGGLAAPERLSGQVEVRALAIGSGEGAVKSDEPFVLELRDGALALEGAPLEGPKQKLVLSAAGTLAQEPRLVVDGVAAASLFSRASEPLVQALGDVGLHFEWRPGAEQPVSGFAEMRELQVRVKQAIALRKLCGKLVLDGERVRLDGVAADLGEGRLELRGALARDGLRVAGYELDIKAIAAELEPEPHLELTVEAEGRLTWAGGAEVPSLNGHLYVDKLVYGRHIQMPEALTAINRDDRATRAGFDAARDRLRFDLEIEHGVPLRVRNNFLDGELRVTGPTHKLRVVGSDQRFGLLGSVELARGRVLFHGQQFQVTRGSVSFDDETRVAPAFDVRAIGERKSKADPNILFSARGNRDAFNVDVRCDADTAGAAPPPFTCEYAHDALRCDSFEQLVRLWTCRGKTALSREDAP